MGKISRQLPLQLKTLCHGLFYESTNECPVRRSGQSAPFEYYPPHSSSVGNRHANPAAKPVTRGCPRLPDLVNPQCDPRLALIVSPAATKPASSTSSTKSTGGAASRLFSPRPSLDIPVFEDAPTPTGAIPGHPVPADKSVMACIRRAREVTPRGSTRAINERVTDNSAAAELAGVGEFGAMAVRNGCGRCLFEMRSSTVVIAYSIEFCMVGWLGT